MAVLTKITSRSLADNAVTSSHVQGDVIAAGDLAPNSVGASELADNAVDTAAIATDAVTNVKVADGAIDHADKIATGVVTTAKIADSSSTTTGITPAKIAENAVTSAKIATGAVIADGIGAGAVVTAGLGASAVTSAKLAADAVEVIPHIKPGVLHPAYLGNKLDGTATAASTTGPAGSTIASSRYGTVQSDGRMYYYTSIKGSKPIKDPRIGAHFGSQRHNCDSLQLLEQETATHGKNVYSIDGREWMRIQGTGGRPIIVNGSQGNYILCGNAGNVTNVELEITGYFNKANISGYTNSYAGRKWDSCFVNGTEVTTDTSFITTVTTPLVGRYVDGGSLIPIEMGNITSPQITTIRLIHDPDGESDLYNIELIAQDKFTDATCDTTNADATVTMDSTAKLSVGLSVSGTGIAAGSSVASITNATTFELSANATATNSNQTLTFGGSDMSIPPQNVVSYGKKFALSPQSLHYDPFAYKTDGITAWTSPTSGSNNHNGTAWPVGTGGSHNIDTATSLGLAAWVNTNYYRPYNGGRVVIWVDSSGNVKTSVNMMPPNARSISNAANLTGGAEKGDDSAGNTSAATPNDNFRPTFTDQVTDHAQAEVAKTFHWREFGNGSANGGSSGGTYADATMFNTSGDDIAYVMDDGLTHFSGHSVRHNGTLYNLNTNGIYLTFIGTGLSFATPNNANGPAAAAWAQNLPYGTHILKIQAYAAYGGSSGEDHKLTLDGVVIAPQLAGAGSSVPYLGDPEFSIHQPKMPPIPEDAVVLADYMLMADHVNKTSHTAAVTIAKGVRLLDSSRDVFHDTASGSMLLNNLSISDGYPFRNYMNSGSGAKNSKIPTFATSFGIDQLAAVRNDTHVAGSAVAHTDVGTHTHINTPLALGLNIFAAQAASGQDGGFYRFEIATPIHTSSHYQSFETPFLHELVGGDRNMEQTNLVVTPDGKTWDEVTRDVSYLGNVVLNGNVQGSDQTSLAILDEWRGEFAGTSTGVGFNKDWAIAYDRVICLKDGQYEIIVGTLNVNQHQKVHVNATSGNTLIQNHNAHTNYAVINGSAVRNFKRGDYIAVVVMHGSSNYNTFRINRV